LDGGDMTPLILEFISDIYRDNDGSLDPADLMWFDASDVVPETIDLSADVLETPLPFKYTAFVCKTIVEPVCKVLVMLSNNPPIKVDGTVCHAWVKNPETNGTVRLINFYYKIEDGQIMVTYFEIEGNKINELPSDEVSEQDRDTNRTTVALIAAFLDSLNKGTNYYAPTKRANHIKRLRHGKVPLFDWKTVTIEPSKPKREHLGGTHASPRLHDRRGHWRYMKKSGKKVWVKDCKVGDPLKGIIFHDYKFKEQRV
jgi:hypothetical protein